MSILTDDKDSETIMIDEAEILDDPINMGNMGPSIQILDETDHLTEPLNQVFEAPLENEEEATSFWNTGSGKQMDGSSSDFSLERQKLQNEISDLKAKLETVNKKPQGGGKEFLELRELLNKKDKEMLALRDQLSKKDQEIASINSQFLDLAKEKSEQSDRSIIVEREREELLTQVESLTDQKIMLSKQQQTLQQEFSTLQQKNRETEVLLKNERERNEKAFSDLLSQKADYETKTEQLKDSFEKEQKIKMMQWEKEKDGFLKQLGVLEDRLRDQEVSFMQSRKQWSENLQALIKQMSLL